MLTHPLLEQLRQLRCNGMAQALQEQLNQTDSHQLVFEERLALLVKREQVLRDSRRLQTRLRQAKLKEQACMEDIDYQSARRLDKSILRQLRQCDWLRRKHNVLITGPTGTGKTYLACALSHRACLENFTARYWRLPRLFQAIKLAHADGSYPKLITQIAKVQCLILDDWGLSTLNDQQRRDLLEILDDRHNQTSTIVTSQLPFMHWHEAIGEPTLADAILDRLVHNAYKITLTGDSMRKLSATKLADKND